MNNNYTWALSHFGVSDEQCQKTLALALKKGGDYADLFFEHTVINSLVLRDGEVNNVSSSVDFGVGIRVVVGEKTGYAFSETISQKELFEAARTASFIARGSNSFPALSVPITPLVERKNFYPILNPWSESKVGEKSDYLNRLNQRIFELDNRIVKVSLSITDTTQHILFANSLGGAYYDYRPMVVLSAMCVMQSGDRIENNNASRSFRMGTEFLTNSLIEELATEVVSRCALLFEAVQPKGGEMSVVMGAGGSGILLHEAIGHAFEADFIRKGTSIFTDKLGKQICDSQISVVDDATVLNNRGSINYDDEGVLGQKTYIVKEGILNSFLHDRISAQALDSPLTGNGRRENFRYFPVPRMRSTYMENGQYDEKELIANVKRGVYVDHFSNGEVQIGAGDFTFYVKSGYLIENGQLTRPLKDLNVIGNGPEALRDILMVANNSTIDNGAWTCGKEGQSAPVTCGMPSVLVKKLVVG